MAKSTYTIFEIAAGIGMLGHGVSLALESLGRRGYVVGGIERDSAAAAAWLEGMELAQGSRPPLWDDATTFVARRDRVPRAGSGVEIVCAGYPCQPFSSAGRRLGGRDERHLWPACRRIVARLKPGIVFFENVDGHVSMGAWKVIRDLERLGYAATPGVFSAEEVGAPHLRKRVFILGVLADAAHGRGGLGDEVARQGDTILEGGGGELGDAQCAEPGSGSEGEQSGARRGWGGCVDPGGGVASGDGDEFKTDTVHAGSGRDGARGVGGGGEAIFPPGRNEYARWAELAERGLDVSLFPATRALDSKHLETAIRRALRGVVAGANRRQRRKVAAGMAAKAVGRIGQEEIESSVSMVAHGLAPSADLLRIGGNGVVPLCAAWAFVSLLACVTGSGVEQMEARERAGTLWDC